MSGFKSRTLAQSLASCVRAACIPLDISRREIVIRLHLQVCALSLCLACIVQILLSTLSPNLNPAQAAPVQQPSNDPTALAPSQNPLPTVLPGITTHIKGGPHGTTIPSTREGPVSYKLPPERPVRHLRHRSQAVESCQRCHLLGTRGQLPWADIFARECDPDRPAGYAPHMSQMLQ